MKIPFFGRKPTPAAPGTTAPTPEIADTNKSPAHALVLEEILRREADDPIARPNVVGGLLFGWMKETIAKENRTRLEDLLGILASTGGFSCLLAAIDELKASGERTSNDLLAITGKDGRRYIFGDVPNRYLLESPQSLLSFALGALKGRENVKPVDVAMEAIRRTASNIGGETFGIPDLPDNHRPGDLPINYVRHFWPSLQTMLRTYEVPSNQRPATIGIALQRATVAGKDVLDLELAARIIVECAVPMSKVDPVEVGLQTGHLGNN